MTSPTLYNEKQLLERISEGDPIAYASIFDHYSTHVYTLSLKFTKEPSMAEDLTQEIFIRLWMNREKLKEVRDFKAWLNTVSKNLLRNFLNKKVLVPENESYLQGYFKESSASTQDLLEFRELQSALHAAIEELPLQLKKVFTLSRTEGLSHEAIARQLNLSKVTVKSYIFRSLVLIRAHLSRHHPLLMQALLLFLAQK